ncbi:MAG: hypothetical protein P8H53_02565, partial [Paracoccaceae bacterium]|nr:hypothetical protein [Paracoccaceae bacterium]
MNAPVVLGFNVIAPWPVCQKTKDGPAISCRSVYLSWFSDALRAAAVRLILVVLRDHTQVQ